MPLPMRTPVPMSMQQAKASTTCVLCPASAASTTRTASTASASASAAHATRYQQPTAHPVGGVGHRRDERRLLSPSPAAGLSGSGTAVLRFPYRTRSFAPTTRRTGLGHRRPSRQEAWSLELGGTPLHRFFPSPASLPGAMHVNSTTATLNPQQSHPCPNLQYL
jgi:hypothetical protein